MQIQNKTKIENTKSNNCFPSSGIAKWKWSLLLLMLLLMLLAASLFTYLWHMKNLEFGLLGYGNQICIQRKNSESVKWIIDDKSHSRLL